MGVVMLSMEGVGIKRQCRFTRYRHGCIRMIRKSIYWYLCTMRPDRLTVYGSFENREKERSMMVYAARKCRDRMAWEACRGNVRR
jgi:hypothetical protein